MFPPYFQRVTQPPKPYLKKLKNLLADIGKPQEYLRAEKLTPGNRILLVEDNEAAVIQVKSILESDGYSVDVTNDGKEALEYIEQTIPDGIILDLMMPRWMVLKCWKSSAAVKQRPRSRSWF